ncbi:MAG: 50S ribosomal protein L29 [Anaerolineae bacterium]|nr:50S ribosomal protein L29 [Anaerolineae bacterium]
MYAKELRELSTDELRHRLPETRRELFNLRQQWFAGSLQDENRIRAVRKDVARILTLLRERELMQEMVQVGETPLSKGETA